MKIPYRRLALLLFLLPALAVITSAQDTPTPAPFVTPPPQLTGEVPADTGIYVTTQDFLNLRTGPGETFPVMDVIPPEATLMAIGRTADTRWVQVVRPGGVRGWLFVRFLVYSGDVVTLPVDGVNPVPFIRQAGAVGVTSREAIIYDREGFAVGTLPAGERVELTGRLGSGAWSRYQLLRGDGQLYWIGSWDVRIVSGNTLRLFDTAYLYPYGRILRQIDDDIQTTLNSLRAAESIWNSLERGGRARCDALPPRSQRRVTDFDVQQEALFAPAVTALDVAIANTNAAVAALEDACTRALTEGEAFVTVQNVREVQAGIDTALINLNLAASMYQPLQRRDPLIRILSGQAP